MLYVVTGPPAAGKSTWVRDRATHGDITIDFDALAGTLTPGNVGHSPPHHVKEVAFAARKAAIDKAVTLGHGVDVYIIHSTCTAKQLAWYERKGAEIITIDPGYDIVLERCRQERPPAMLDVARTWYADQAYIPLA